MFIIILDMFCFKRDGKLVIFKLFYEEDEE